MLIDVRTSSTKKLTNAERGKEKATSRLVNSQSTNLQRSCQVQRLSDPLREGDRKQCLDWNICKSKHLSGVQWWLTDPNGDRFVASVASDGA